MSLIIFFNWGGGGITVFSTCKIEKMSVHMKS